MVLQGTAPEGEEEEHQAGRFEHFLDPLYVAIVANFSAELAEHPDGAHMAKYMLMFAPAWHIWADLREIMNYYFTDDLLQRPVILWVMAFLVLYANNANDADVDISACTLLLEHILLLASQSSLSSSPLRSHRINVVLRLASWLASCAYSKFLDQEQAASDVYHGRGYCARDRPDGRFLQHILGEFVYSIIVGNKTGIGLTSEYAKAVCT
ncbi:hypothetical protein H9L39_20339 [Fusarium oxysporum f. sp. albedinis]|nr:hypothetical protein H9L39_20339 [Fusarium oxysporum f. sp. albedinis]